MGIYSKGKIHSPMFRDRGNKQIKSVSYAIPDTIYSSALLFILDSSGIIFLFLGLHETRLPKFTCHATDYTWLWNLSSESLNWHSPGCNDIDMFVWVKSSENNEPIIPITSAQGNAMQLSFYENQKCLSCSHKFSDF